MEDIYEISILNLDRLNDVTYYSKTNLGVAELDDFSFCQDIDVSGRKLFFQKNENSKIKYSIPCGLKRSETDSSKRLPLSFLHVTYNDTIMTFTIRKFRILKRDSDRLHAIVYCNNQSTGEFYRNIYYTSKSEGNIWRYCTTIRNDRDIIYNKGRDYISTTFVHVQLQKLLFMSLLNFVPERIDTDDIQCPPSMGLPRELSSRLEDDTVISRNIFFNVITSIFPLSGQMTNAYEECLGELTRIIKDTRFRDSQLDIYNLYKELSENLRRSGVYRSIREGESRREFYQKVYDVIKNMFNKYFRIITSPILIIENNISNIYGVEVKCNIYEIKCQCYYRSDNMKIYIIRYMIYTISSDPRTIRKAIIHIIPDGAHITKFGLDSRYVSCGVFINKIFDYESHTSVTHLRGDPTKKYTFIGDFVNYDFLPVSHDDALVRGIIDRSAGIVKAIEVDAAKPKVWHRDSGIAAAKPLHSDDELKERLISDIMNKISSDGVVLTSDLIDELNSLSIDKLKEKLRRMKK